MKKTEHIHIGLHFLCKKFYIVFVLYSFMIFAGCNINELDITGLPRISTSTNSVSEYGVAKVNITISPAVPEDVILDYTTVDATAIAGSDYRSTSGSIQFSKGDTSAFINVYMLSDQIEDDGEYFYVSVSNTNLGSSRVKITINEEGTKKEKIKNVAKIYSGEENHCIINTSGNLYCWGQNDSGSDGVGFFAPIAGANNYTVGSGDFFHPVIYNPLSAKIKLLALSGEWRGGYCAVNIYDEIFCKSHSPNRLNPGPRETPFLINPYTGGIITKIVAGGDFACVLSSVGSLQCWGEGDNGRRGNGLTTDTYIPAGVTGLTAGVLDVELGLSWGCAVKADQTVACWGENSYGQLGDSTTTQRLVPVGVSGITNAVAVATGGAGHSCAVINNGSIYCWGNNSHGQLGNGTTANSLVPVQVTGITNAISVAVPTLANIWSSTELTQGIHRSCALLSTGQVKCWGQNNYGLLGNGDNSDSSTPVLASELPAGIKGVSLAANSACAITAQDEVTCWGMDTSGQLGRGKKAVVSETPVDITALGTSVVQLSAADKHICALTDSNKMYCWGFAREKALGTHISEDTGPLFIATPKEIVGLAAKTIKQVAAVGAKSCAVFVDGSAQCIGDNDHGSIGDGTYSPAFSMTDVTAPSGSLNRIATGVTNEWWDIHFTCGLLTTGEVECWGHGLYGQMGNGSGTGDATAVKVTGLTTATQVSTSNVHACAIKDDKTAVCWGRNISGELGDSTTTQRNSPVPVVGLANLTQILTSHHEGGETSGDDATGPSTCALNESGNLYCWGLSNFNLFLQGASPTNFSSPVQLPISNVSQFALGSAHACALLTNGEVRCWGGNLNSESGQPQTISVDTPTLISSLTGEVESLVAGSRFTCALMKNKSVKCWGGNMFKQLGDQMDTKVPKLVLAESP